MKYPKEYLDEIKTRLKVSNVVSRSVTLKKRGKEFVGLSPFKNEKTPSFTVNDDKGFYHCFSTSEHGNIFDFVMKTQNFKFGEAVKYLANLAGMRPYTFSQEDQIRENKWKNYSSLYSDYVSFYNEEILKNQEANVAREYLKLRKLNSQDVKRFKIGYIKKNSNFYDKIKDKYDDKFLKECGLFFYDEKRKNCIERFRERIIFPINSLTGYPIGIGGRVIQKNSKLAKYINSPETEFFKKGNNLYNLDKARKLSNSLNEIFLVEGYMDVIGMVKNGIENCVANLGTALTNKQIIILNQFFDEIVICFDSDESGYKAAYRAAENLIKELKPEKQITFLFLPEGEDPDSYVNENGKEMFLDYFSKNKIFIHEFIFRYYKKQTTNSPSSLAIFEKNLREIAKNINDEFIKKYVLEYFLENISELTPHSGYKNKNFPNKQTKSLKSTQKYFTETESFSQIELKEFSFLYVILNNLDLMKKNINMIENVKLFSQENEIIFEEIFNKLKSESNLVKEHLNIDEQLFDKILRFSPIKHILKNKSNEEEILKLLEEIIKDLKNYELELRILELESKFSKDFSETTFNEIKELKKSQKFN